MHLIIVKNRQIFKREGQNKKNCLIKFRLDNFESNNPVFIMLDVF